VDYAEGILGVNLQGALQAERFYQKQLSCIAIMVKRQKGKKFLGD
jgi:hypothetical protein